MKNQSQITINGTDYTVRQTVRSLFIYEEITKRQFKVETLLDNYLYFYCVLLACNPDNPLDWDDYLDALDEDPEIFTRINEILTRKEKIDSLMGEEDKEEAEKKS